uniref:Uncharacterized protein n=1 Tax=Aureoumbra lagunensis TaxID=44058 RepID=A0A7S3NK99_9STRA
MFVHVDTGAIWDKNSPRDNKKYKLKARLTRMIERRGFWKQPTTEQKKEHEEDSEAKRDWERQNKEALSFENAGIAFDAVKSNWAWFECFVLKYHPTHTFAEKIRGWEKLEGEFDEPVSTQLVYSIIKCIMRKKGVFEDGSNIPGMGNMYPSVKNLCYAISKMHYILRNIPDPTKDFTITRETEKWKKQHRTNYHRGFDAHEGLLTIYAAISTMPHWTEQKKVQAMAMSLYTFHHGHRISENAQYCLMMDDISLPRYASAYDSEHFPMFINVIYRNWKARKASEKGLEYPQQFHRNPFDIRADPVYWILAWMDVAEHAPNQGPLFGQHETVRNGGGIRKAHHKIKDDKGIEIWYTEDERRVNWTDLQVRTIFLNIIDRCAELSPWECEGDEDWTLIKPHDWRVAFVSWVARCNGDAIYARKGARFADHSTDFYMYWNLGAIKRDQYVIENVEDPIWTFNPFPPQGVTYSGTRVARQGRPTLMPRSS